MALTNESNKTTCNVPSYMKTTASVQERYSKTKTNSNSKCTFPCNNGAQESKKTIVKLTNGKSDNTTSNVPHYMKSTSSVQLKHSKSSTLNINLKSIIPCNNGMIESERNIPGKTSNLPPFCIHPLVQNVSCCPTCSPKYVFTPKRIPSRASSAGPQNNNAMKTNAEEEKHVEPKLELVNIDDDEHTTVVDSGDSASLKVILDDLSECEIDISNTPLRLIVESDSEHSANSNSSKLPTNQLTEHAETDPHFKEEESFEDSNTMKKTAEEEKHMEPKLELVNIDDDEHTTVVDSGDSASLKAILDYLSECEIDISNTPLRLIVESDSEHSANSNSSKLPTNQLTEHAETDPHFKEKESFEDSELSKNECSLKENVFKKPENTIVSRGYNVSNNNNIIASGNNKVTDSHDEKDDSCTSGGDSTDKDFQCQDDELNDSAATGDDISSSVYNNEIIANSHTENMAKRINPVEDIVNMVTKFLPPTAPGPHVMYDDIIEHVIYMNSCRNNNTFSRISYSGTQVKHNIEKENCGRNRTKNLNQSSRSFDERQGVTRASGVCKSVLGETVATGKTVTSSGHNISDYSKSSSRTIFEKTCTIPNCETQTPYHDTAIKLIDNTTQAKYTNNNRYQAVCTPSHEEMDRCLQMPMSQTPKELRFLFTAYDLFSELKFLRMPADYFKLNILNNLCVRNMFHFFVSLEVETWLVICCWIASFVMEINV